MPLMGWIPCHRVCYWCKKRKRWVAYVTRTRNYRKVVEQLQSQGFAPDEILIDLRPGRGQPMPMPTRPGPVRPRVYTGG